MPIKNQPNIPSKVYLPKLSAEKLNNQTRFQHNFLQDYLLKQQIQNERLKTLLTNLQQDSIEIQERNLQQYSDIDSKLERNDSVAMELLTKFAALDNETSKMEEQLASLILLAQEQKKLISEESLRQTALFDQVSYQEKDISMIADKLAEFNQLASEVKMKMEETETNYQYIAEKLDLQEIFHQTLLESMEETNGNVNKLARQLEHMKEVLFERVHYLAEKIENNIKSISLPIQQLFLPSERDETIKK